MKVHRRWIVLDWLLPGCLRAEDIPYDASINVKEAIDNVGMNKNGVDTGETVTVPNNHHWIVQDQFYVDGDLIVDGDMLLI